MFDSRIVSVVSLRRALLLSSLPLALLGSGMSAPAVAADPVQAIQPAAVNLGRNVDFERDVYPILDAKCMACHNVALNESALILEDVKNILKGGKRGPSVKPGKPDESLLYVLSARGKAPAMPPLPNKVEAAAITPQELGVIRQWIQEGANASGGSINKAPDWISLNVHSIYSVALTSDGTYAAAGRGNQIAVYHVPSGQQIAALTDPAVAAIQSNGKPMYPAGTSHRDSVHALSFSPDGKTLASASYREVKLWSRPDPVAKLTLPAGIGQGTVLALSRDDAWLAVATPDNSIQLWDFKNPSAAARKISGHTAAVTGLQFTADGKRLLSSSTDKSVRIWDLADGKQVGRIDAPSALNGLTLSQDGKKLITAGADKIVRIWELPSVDTPALALPAIPAASALSPDRKVLAVADPEGKITLFDLPGRKTLRVLTGHQGTVHSIAFQANGSKLVSGGADKTVRIWDVAKGQSVLTLQGPATAVSSVAWQTYVPQVSSAGTDGRVSLWKLDANPPRPLTAGAAPATISALSRDGKLLATDGTADGKPAILIRDLVSGQTTRTLTGPTAAVTAIAFSGDGTRIVAGAADKIARVWNLADGKQLGQFTGHAQPLTAVAFPGNNNLLAITAAADGSLKVWNVADAKEQAVKFNGLAGTVTALVSLANGQFVTATDQAVRVWNANGQPGANIAFGQPVAAIAVSVDGSKLAVGGKDKSAKIFQIDGKQLFVLEGHGAAIRNLGFSVDNTRLVTAGSDQVARVWDVATGALLESLPVTAGLNAAQFAVTSGAIVAAAADKSVTIHSLHIERQIVAAQPKPITALLYTPKGDALFIAQEDGAWRRVLVANGQQQAAQNHGSAIRALALTTDGATLATAGDNKQVKLWTVANGAPAPKHVLDGATATIRGLAFLPDNLHIAAACDDQRTVVYSVKLGTVEQIAVEPSGSVRNVFAYGDNGRQFASISTDKMVRTWPLLAGLQIVGHAGSVTSIAILPNSNQVVTGSEDGTVRFWDHFAGNQTRVVAHGGPVRGIAVSPDGKFAVSVGSNNAARLWNAGNSQMVMELRGDRRTESVLKNAMADDAEVKGLLASLKGQIPPAEKKVTELTEVLKKATEAKAATEKKFVEVTAKAKGLADQAMAARKAADAKKGDKALVKAADDAKKANDAFAAELKKAEDEKTKAADAHLQADANLREAGTAVAKLKAEQQETLARQKQAEPILATARTAAQQREKPFFAAAFSRNGKELALVNELGVVGTYDGVTGLPLEAFDAHNGPALGVAFTKDGTVLSAGSDKTIKAWNLLPPWTLVGIMGPKPEAPSELQNSIFVGRVLCLDFSPDGKILAAGGGDPSRSGEITLWDVSARKLIKALNDVHSDTVFGLQFSRDGKLLLSGAADKFVKIVDWQTGKVIKPFEGHTGHVLDVSWRHDGKRIASAGADNAIKVWNVETGEQERTIQGFGKQVTSLHYMGRGDNLVSSCGDRTVRYHTGSNGGNFRSFAGANDFLYSAASSADEKVVISGGQDGVLRIWNGTNGQLLQSLSPNKPTTGTASAMRK